MTKLFIASLPWKTTDQELSELFEQFGGVLSAKVIMDHDTGRSRGFGFVEMENDTEAKQAIEKLNGVDYQGRKLVVNEARPK